MIRRYLPGLLLGLLLFLGTGSLNHRPVAAAQADPAAQILQLINDFRVSIGLPPYSYNPLLAAAAQSHANWMAASVIYSHTGAGGSSPQSRAAAAGYVGFVSENIVGGSNQSPRQGLIWWQNSATHYNTLASSHYVEAGIGFATNGEQNMYVLVVGRPTNSPPAPNNNSQLPGPLIITPIKLAEPREDGSIVHVMQPGQAMWTIAAYYDVDLDYLYLINGLNKDNVLHPGDEVTVRLADGQEPPPTPTPPLTHVVRSGESAWSIAGQHGISLDFLYLLNNMGERSTLQPGQEIVVRLAEGQAPPPTPTPRITHIIQNGQSLWLIAAQYGLTLDQLLALNSLTADSVIRPGDELIIRPPTPTPLPMPTFTPTPEDTSAFISNTPVPADAVLAANAPPGDLVLDSAAKLPAANAVDLNPDADTSSNNLAGVLAVIVGLSLVVGIVIVLVRQQN